MMNKLYYLKLIIVMVIFGNLPIKEAIRCFKEVNKKTFTSCRTAEYDEEKILSAKSKFKTKKLKDITVCFDLDNTILKYSVGGNDRVSLMLQAYKGFYSNLGVMRGTFTTICLLKLLGINYIFLTSALTNQYCRPEKKISLKKKLGPLVSDDKIVFVDPGKDKAEKLRSLGYDISNCILVDDYWVNLISWLENGGFSIKKTYSGKERPIPTAKKVTDVIKILLATCDTSESKFANILDGLLN